MTSRQRFLATIKKEIPDRLPVTIHHVMPYFLETYMNGISCTPPSLGGDVDLREAKKKIGNRVCMIGGFDQALYFRGCPPEETRKAVRQCFEKAGEGGGYILAPSDHFFDADIKLIRAFSDEAGKCVY